MASIVTLTTDFGLSDHFAGVMKGVILGICPNAQIVDITHECSPYAIPEAAFTIAQSYRYFPPKTVHVVVVDPGVGTARRPILVEAAGQFFLGPDNGVFGMILSQEKHKVRVITNEKYLLHPVSRTFHGRDVFAPVAAHLAKGIPPARIGKIIEDYAQPKPASGTVLKIDRFGNIVTSFLASDFPPGKFAVQVGQWKVMGRADNYAQFGRGEPFAIAGSSGYIEISVREASAAKLLGVALGAPVKITAPRRSARRDS